jgi:hypothetical protein
MFPHKVEVDLNMLRALVLNGVGREVDDADVAAVDEGALHQWSVELLKLLSQPTNLCHTIGYNLVLNLDTRAGDDVMTLRRSGDEVGAEEHNVVRGGPACVWATCPICISIDRQHGGGRAL